MRSAPQWRSPYAEILSSVWLVIIVVVLFTCLLSHWKWMKCWSFIIILHDRFDSYTNCFKDFTTCNIDWIRITIVLWIHVVREKKMRFSLRTSRCFFHRFWQKWFFHRKCDVCGLSCQMPADFSRWKKEGNEFKNIFPVKNKQNCNQSWFIVIAFGCMHCISTDRFQ